MLSKMSNKWMWLALAGLIVLVSPAASASEGGSFFTVAKNMSFMGYVLIVTSIAGVALGLQAFVSIRPHLLRPPHTAQELIALCQEGNLDEAAELAQSEDNFLAKVATAALANAQYGEKAMESAMADAGEIETAKYVAKIGVLNLIAALAPMLGLTGTTLGMIKTFAVIGEKADAVTASDMAIGISEALVCTFIGLAVAIPLLSIAFFLKTKLMQSVYEISNDVGEMIRCVGGAEKAQ
jgi:biopolymer transport protein ExbB